jgi:ATP:corrinoid adenosyltransferase
MTEQNQPGRDPSESDIAEELRTLGKNLKDALLSVWESDERKKLEDEIRAGLVDLGVTLNEATSDFKKSQAGQQLKEDLQDFRQRVHSGEVSTKVHDELINALRLANIELSKVSSKRSGSQTPRNEEGPDQSAQSQ